MLILEVRMNKVKYFKKEINYIKDERKRKDICVLINLLPDYFFNIPISDDNDKYSEVKNNHCNYYCAFRDAPGLGYNGTIHIEIKATVRVGLHYTDWYNEYLKEQAVVNDL